MKILHLKNMGSSRQRQAATCNKSGLALMVTATEGLIFHSQEELGQQPSRECLNSLPSTPTPATRAGEGSPVAGSTSKLLSFRGAATTGEHNILSTSRR